VRLTSGTQRALGLGLVSVLLGLGAGACDQTVNLGRVVGDGGPMDMGDLGEPGDMGPLDGDTGDGGAGCETPLLADMLALGSDHLCVLRAGAVTCFGGGESGQRCDGESGNTPLPTSPVGFDTYTAVYAAGLNTCLERSDGMLLCCGNNFDGTLGNGGSASSTRPVEVLSGAPRVAMGFSSVYATLTAGTLSVWGANDEGQLGLGDAADAAIRTPTAVPDVAFEEVSASTHHACAVDAAGDLYCTGTNTANELGIPLLTGATEFTLVPAPTTFRSVSAGRRLSCAISTGNALYCWGRNEPTMIAGQMGDVDEPTRVGSDSDWSSVSVGYEHVCGLRSGGRLFCWGNGAGGQLGYEAEAEDTPTEVTPGVSYSLVRTSFAVTCAIRSADAAVVCFGDGASGQLAGRSGSTPETICLD